MNGFFAWCCTKNFSVTAGMCVAEAQQYVSRWQQPHSYMYWLTLCLKTLKNVTDRSAVLTKTEHLLLDDFEKDEF